MKNFKSEVEKEPKFWKGDPAGGFASGLMIGIVVGIINILFLHWWHIGVIVFIGVWLFQGTQPQFKERADKRDKENAKHKDAEEFVHKLPDNTKTVGGVPININVEVKQKEKHTHKPFGALVCPHCKSANIQLLEDNANIKKIKRTSSVNINPLHPLTVFNHHEKKIKKHSVLKTTAAVSTFGVSTMLTGGTRSNGSRKYQCRNCGKVWQSK
ncbi:MAG: hypothetical protein LKJ22_07500 [Liquorilactobacillus nagelii]|jgi:ribosomal protein L34E|uniref:hypothetical protein n=1 Tax=Liquorilactobacillus nagelii TaxID=82688 RepID=UPI00242D00A0|nr:hypothetical protein [Liquorilactobacillus nagelii]MCI1921758.1 hypothetical protein [Liquorilactobacillus nagelii]MCI1976708.1 hypothetical protein [Liquorilactobacillus nagelii]